MSATQHSGLTQRLQSCWVLLLWLLSTGRSLDWRWAAATTVAWSSGGAGSAVPAVLPAQGTTWSAGLPVLPMTGVRRRLHITLPLPAPSLDPSTLLFTGLWPTNVSRRAVSAVGRLKTLAAASSSTRAAGEAPPEFDPDAYLDYNPHLAEELSAHRDTNMPLGQAAWLQYQELLHKGGNISAGVPSGSNGAENKSHHVYCRRMPVVLSYASYNDNGGGLCNQLYTNIAAWVLAAQLGADVLVPPAAKRASFAHGRGYSSVPFDSLFHWPHVRELLQGLGVQARMYPSPDAEPQHMYRDAAAYLRQQLQNLETSSAAAAHSPEAEEEAAAGGRVHQAQQRLWQVLRQSGQLDAMMKDNQFKILQAEKLRDRATAVILQAAHDTGPFAASSVQQATPPGAGARDADGVLPCAQVPLVHLHLDKMLFTLRTLGDALAAHMVSRLRFSAPVEQRAAEVLRAMAARNITRFHGIHLRLEDDSDYHGDFGGKDGVLKAYVDAALRIGIGAPSAERLPIYVASGLSTYSAGIPQLIKAKGVLALLGSEVLTKEDLLLPPQPPAGNALPQQGNGPLPRPLPRLHSEQLAAMDILVLEQASLFVGLGKSSMSVFVQERRLLAGKQPNASALVGFVWPALEYGAMLG